ncbi:hypothetical protein DSUL_20179 [Desulfovibrionales bacterium]
MLVTNATGSNKSTSQTTFIDFISPNFFNAYLHCAKSDRIHTPTQKNALVNQYENWGTNFNNFTQDLRTARRQIPKVILVNKSCDLKIIKAVVIAKLAQSSTSYASMLLCRLSRQTHQQHIKSYLGIIHHPYPTRRKSQIHSRARAPD